MLFPNSVRSVNSVRPSGNMLPEGRTEFTLRTEFGNSMLPRTIPFATQHAFRLGADGQYVDANGETVLRDARRPLPPTPVEPPLCWPVDSFVLIHSELGARNAYTEMGRWTLR